MDDRRASTEGFTWACLLGLLGNSYHEVETKGQVIPWRATHIWITAPMHHQDFLSLDQRKSMHCSDDYGQLTRRITGTTKLFDEYYHEEEADHAVGHVCPGTPPILPHITVDSDSEPEQGVARSQLVTTPSLAQRVYLCCDSDDSEEGN